MVHRLWLLVSRTFKLWRDNNSMRMAAGVAFYTMMSLAPLLVVFLRVLSLKYGHKAEAMMSEEFETFVGSREIASPGSALHQLLHIAYQSRSGAFASWVGVAVALVSGSTLFGSVQDSLNSIWAVKPRPGRGVFHIVRQRILAGAMVVIAMAMLIASFALSAGLTIVAERLGPLRSVLSYAGDVGVTLVIASVMFALIYRYLPDVKVKWSDVWLGAGITGMLFIAGKYGLSIYFRLAAIGNAYGAAGSLAVLLIWVYYSAGLFFFGAAFTRVHAEEKGKVIEPEEHVMRVRQDEDGRRLMSRVRAPRPNRQTASGTGWLGLGIAALIGSVLALIFTSEDRRLRAQAAHTKLRRRLEAIEAAASNGLK
jgi:membrane protein